LGYTRKSAYTPNTFYNGRRRFEHWYRDNQVYFITSRCRDRYCAFITPQAKAIFWDRFGHYTDKFGFEPWVTALIGNHYHTVGHLSVGKNLGPMMQRLHGSVAKLVNDLLPTRHVPFWHDHAHNNYFDGCLRNEQQLRRTYRYVETQPVRAGYHDQGHVRVAIPLNEAVRRATSRNALLIGVPYKRYQRDPKAGPL
jgi:REP element-mobilizing transposase RayT